MFRIKKTIFGTFKWTPYFGFHLIFWIFWKFFGKRVNDEEGDHPGHPFLDFLPIFWGISWKLWGFPENIGLSEKNGLCRWPPWFADASLLWTLWTSCSRLNLFQGPTQKVSFLFRFFCIVPFWLVCFLYYIYVYHHVLLNLTLSHQKNYMNFVHIKRKILLTIRSVF